MDKIEEMKSLITELNSANIAYYRDDNPIMSDKQYDAKYDRLIQLEQETSIILANSPTQKVQGYILDGLNKVKHSKLMLSAAKTKDINTIRKFIGDNDFYGSYKLDGVTLVVKYQNGKFVQAITRGTGEIGEDVTEQATMIINLPMKIPYNQYLELRGECVISWDNFYKINTDLNDKYTHPRNLAGGSLRNLDTSITKTRNLEFVVFECISDLNTNSKWNTLEYLKGIGFTIVDHNKGTVDKIVELMQPEFYKYPVDGLIFELNNIEYSKSLSATEHHEGCRIALKWKDDTYETILRSVEWNTTRTGIISPVAIFDEIDLDGASTTRATLHNLSYIENLELGINDKITVYRANKVIPKVDDNYTRSNNLVIPDSCPICGGKTEIRQENDSKVLICTNPNCSGKLLSRFSHFVSKQAFNIDGLSEASLEKFIDKGWIKTFADIYHLDEHKLEIINMDGFGKKSYAKMWTAIQNSRNVKLSNFLVGLGISNVGKTASKTISKYFNGDWQKFILSFTNNFDWTTLDDFGDVIANSLTNYFCNSNNREEWKSLLDEVTFIKPQQTVSIDNATVHSNPFTGKKLYATGTFANYKKDQLKELIEGMGAEFTSGYAKSLDYLIVGSLKGSGKVDKALKDGIPVLQEDEFINMINNH